MDDTDTGDIAVVVAVSNNTADATAVVTKAIDVADDTNDAVK